MRRVRGLRDRVRRCRTQLSVARTPNAATVRARMLDRRIPSGIVRAAVIAVIAACLAWFVRAIDWSALGHALATAKPWPLVLAAALNFACLYGKAACWRIMFAPRPI